MRLLMSAVVAIFLFLSFPLSSFSQDKSSSEAGVSPYLPPPPDIKEKNLPNQAQSQGSEMATIPFLQQSTVVDEKQIEKTKNEFLNKTKNNNPVLYEYRKRLFTIVGEIDEVAKKYRAGKITRANARERIEPLVKERISILHSPEFMLENEIEILLKKE